MHRTLALIAIVALITASVGHAACPDPRKDRDIACYYPVAPSMARHTLFAELGGSAGPYSLNYDHRFTEMFSLRGGFTAFTVSGIGDGVLFATLVPIVANALLGTRHHKLELGLGAVPVYVRAGGSFFETEGAGVLGTAVLGYRYAPWAGGFSFRAAFTPFVGPGGAIPWGAISFGWAL